MPIVFRSLHRPGRVGAPGYSRAVHVQADDTSADANAVAAPVRRNQWMHGPVLDVLLGWCFLPVAVVVHFAEPHLTLVQTMMAVIFVVSFAHQPLTLGLVQTDSMSTVLKDDAYALSGLLLDLIGPPESHQCPKLPHHDAIGHPSN